MSRARASRTSCAPRRRSATRSCARVPEDQSARLPITGRHVIGRSEPSHAQASGAKSRGTRRAACHHSRSLAARRSCRPRAGRDVLGPTRPASRKAAKSQQPARPRFQERPLGCVARAISPSRATQASAPMVRSQRARPRAGTSAAARPCPACSAREGPRACAPEPWRAASGLATGVPAFVPTQHAG
jgi:hypothetical protein